ncbi:MAG: YbhN family protein [Cypionkella sp.]|nr:YbhN family protein [Cypionkella sp.]
MDAVVALDDHAGDVASLGAVSLSGQLPRAGLTLALGGLLLWLLSQRVADLDFAAVAAAIAGTAPHAWAAAAALTAIAFWAVGRYDALLHRHFETGVAPSRARAAGISAIAVSQVLGMGMVTGAILRWRMLPEQSLWQVSRLTLAVALSFLAGWAIVAGVILLVGPAHYAWPAFGVLGLAAAGAALAVLRPNAPFRWPNLMTMSGVLGLCALDTLAAASALYVLLPPSMALPFATLLPAFLLAYGAGLVSGTPGGIGAFELALLALLPPQSNAPILAAVIAWRLVYFVLPALLGAAYDARHARSSSWRVRSDLIRSDLIHWAHLPMRRICAGPQCRRKSG